MYLSISFIYIYGYNHHIWYPENNSKYCDSTVMFALKASGI